MFTREQLQALGLGPLAGLLSARATTWQLALAVWRALGAPDAPQLLLDSAQLAADDWLAPGRLANLLALRRGLGLASPGAVVQQQGLLSYARYAPERLAGRLLFLEQAGRRDLLVVSKEQWRRERGRKARPRKTPADEPPLVSLSDVGRLNDEKLAAAAGLDLAALRAFTAPAALASHLPYRQLLAEVAALRGELLRDPEVARLAAVGAEAAGARRQRDRRS